MRAKTIRQYALEKLFLERRIAESSAGIVSDKTFDEIVEEEFRESCLKAPYVFHPEAEKELREIIRYTRKNWGDAQAKKYVAKFRECFQALASGKQVCKDISVLYPALRMATAKAITSFI